MEVNPTPDDLSRAVVAWTGHGTSPTPVRDPAPVRRQFGDRAVDLVPTVHALAAEFDRSDAVHREADLADAGRLAAQEFHRRHPELSIAAVEALAWCYTWDHR